MIGKNGSYILTHCDATHKCDAWKHTSMIGPTCHILRLVLTASHFESFSVSVPTESDDFPEQDAETPAVGLLVEGVVVERLRRHPADRQSALADRSGNTLNTVN